MTKYHSKETIQANITSAAVRMWGEERTEILKPVLTEVVDQIFQVAQFPLPFEEEPAFFSSSSFLE